MTRALVVVASLASCLVLAGCGDRSSSLDPAGSGAGEIERLWWVLLGATLVPFVVVLGLLAIALLRRGRDDDSSPFLGRLTDRQLIAGGGLALPVLVLVPIVVMSLAVGRTLDAEAQPDRASFEIEVHGRQFWWDLRYPAAGSRDPRGTGSFRTANEIHVPVGQTVTLRLLSDDVIHSFWIPRLHGKMDLIPGRVNRLAIRADEPGEFRGQCAELCGLGHAFMRLVVIAQPPDEFREWWERESRAIAPEALAAVSSSTRQTFANSCGPCHTVRGLYDRPEVFAGDFGPDLTHMAARRRIANLLPNSREGLGRWIVDPAGVKPGNRMPDVGLNGAQLSAIVDFLRTLE